ncbi:MAG: AAA family ATPase [Campylobacterota bacterium]|nr:AAA family ATPase [Campylobacterota bacterium]
MKIWNIVLNFETLNDNILNNIFTNHNISICLEAKSNPIENFNFISARKGDVFYLSINNYPKKIIGMFKDNLPFYLDSFIYREFELILFCDNKLEHIPFDSNSDLTFYEIIDIKSFTNKILNPIFENKSYMDIKKYRSKSLQKLSVTINKLLELQQIFQKLSNKQDATYLFNYINNLSKIEIEKLLFIYTNTTNLHKKPIALLRKEILLLLKHDETIDAEVIDRFKQTLVRGFDKDVYRNWRYPFEVLYFLYYFQFEDEISIYLTRFVNLIQKKLKIEEFTISNKPVDFNGESNKGNNTVWFSIFNNNFSKQLHAFQLFLSIDSGKFRYGLFHMDQKDKNEIVTTTELCFKDMIKLFSKYIDLVKYDNSKEKAIFTETIDLLSYQKQIILQGPPGTGKTRLAKLMARYIVNGQIKPYIDDVKDQIRIIQFHPSYSYEDFVRGITAKSNGDQIEYKTEDKILVEMAEKARKALGSKYFLPETTEDEKTQIIKYSQKFVLIIDEINRANLASVFGELIYALEYRDESVESMYDIYGQREITLPSNLYIMGTMNTADRSIGHIDYAIRRRFTFVDLLPDISAVNDDSKFLEVQALFKNSDNERADTLSVDFHPNDVMLGHSYFIAENNEELQNKLEYQVKPLLREYIKDGVLLEHAEDIIKAL